MDEKEKEKIEERKTARQRTRAAAKKLKEETRKQVILAITAAFGFLIALVWKDAIVAYVNKLIESLMLEGPQPLILLYTALITTIVAVLGIILINKLKPKEE